MTAPLVFLPGLLCDRRIFHEQLLRFDGLAVDGFGCRTSLEEMARFALEEAPARMSLLGHSMGARVALEMFRMAPERIERLALVSTGVHGVRPGEAEKRFAVRDLGRWAGADALVDHWLPPMVASSRLSDRKLMDGLRQICIEAGVPVFNAQITALLNRPEVQSLLPTIDRPTLVAGGELDAWSPPEQHRSIAAAIPRAMLRIIPGAGHMLPVETPDALNEAISAWLNLCTH